jgi:hypothetical protein
MAPILQLLSSHSSVKCCFALNWSNAQCMYQARLWELSTFFVASKTATSSAKRKPVFWRNNFWYSRFLRRDFTGSYNPGVNVRFLPLITCSVSMSLFVFVASFSRDKRVFLKRKIDFWAWNHTFFSMHHQIIFCSISDQIPEEHFLTLEHAFRIINHENRVFSSDSAKTKKNGNGKTNNLKNGNNVNFNA